MVFVLRARVRRLWSAAAVLVAVLPGLARADAVLDANGLLLEAIRTTHPAPPLVTRQIAILNAAMFDSANAAVGLRYEPYSYDGMPIVQASPEMGARAAGSAVLRALFPDLKDPALVARIVALGEIPAGNDIAVAVGRACAEAVVKARSHDGAFAAGPPFMGSDAPGWRPEKAATQGGVLPHWGTVEPWVIGDVARIRVPQPPAIGSMAWLDSYNAVKALGTPSGASQSPEFAQIAAFWADEEGTETPPGHWIEIARELAGHDGGDVVDHARLFALLGFAMADTATVVWRAKYRFQSWRPISAVRGAARLGDARIFGDPRWVPLLETPDFPEYPSGHSAFSAAAARTMALVFGRDDIALDTGTRARRMESVRRHYNHLSAAAEEAGLSRIYGGIHFYFSHRAAVDVGRQVADMVVADRLRRLAR